MILSDLSILERLRETDATRRLVLEAPDLDKKEEPLALLNSAGIKIRIAEDSPDVFAYGPRIAGSVSTGRVYHAITMERVEMPHDLMGVIHTTSSMARYGLAITNDSPRLQPGWRGRVVLELTYVGNGSIQLMPGMEVGELVLHQLTTPTSRPYKGRYQDQMSIPEMRRYNPMDFVLDIRK